MSNNCLRTRYQNITQKVSKMHTFSQGKNQTHQVISNRYVTLYGLHGGAQCIIIRKVNVIVILIDREDVSH